MKGLMIAGPQTGSGKTTVTLGLLRALKRKGVALAPAKAGPDHIDPALHLAAAGVTCLNYDSWAMRPDLISANAALSSQGGRTLVMESTMGLFDAAPDGRGASAELAKLLDLPVVLVIDCSRMTHSVAALANGFTGFAPNVYVAGVILNRVKDAEHEKLLRSALEPANVTVFGCLPEDQALVRPDLRLGQVRPEDNSDLQTHMEQAADLIERRIDLAAIERIGGQGLPFPAPANILRLPPPGQKIAVARDLAFAFCHEHLLFGWRRRGAEISFFSPLADEGPERGCDAVYLPGGYPEFHAGAISAATHFRAGIDAAIGHGVPVYGEGGGYMVLGEELIDSSGARHTMIGALPLVSSFAQTEFCSGYRRLTPLGGFFWDMGLGAHESRYATSEMTGAADPLFQAEGPGEEDLGTCGMRRGNVFGSHMHVIDRTQ